MMSPQHDEEDQPLKLICPYCGIPLEVAEPLPIEIMDDGCGVRLFFLCPVEELHFTLEIPIPLHATLTKLPSQRTRPMPRGM